MTSPPKNPYGSDPYPSKGGGPKRDYTGSHGDYDDAMAQKRAEKISERQPRLGNLNWRQFGHLRVIDGGKA